MKYQRIYLLKGLASSSSMSDTSDVEFGTTIGEPRNDSGRFLYTASRNANTTFYFESVLNTSNETIYASLYSSGASQVSSSEVSHSTGSNNVRHRSSAITLSDGVDYHVRWRLSVAEAGNTFCYTPKVIADFDGSKSDTEIQIPMCYGNSWIWNTPDYDFVVDNEEADVFYYDSANWQQDTEFYFEMDMAAEDASYAAEGILYNFTDSSNVDTISTTSTTTARVRSSEVNLTTAKEYRLRGSSDGPSASDRAFYAFGKMIAYVPNAGQFEVHHNLTPIDFQNSNHASYVGYTGGRLYWEPTKWDDTLKEVFYETVMKASSGNTVYQQIAEWTSDTTRTEITATEISTTTTTPVRVRGTDIKGDLPVSAAELKAEWKVSAGSTGNDLISGSKLIFKVADDLSINVNDTVSINEDTDTNIEGVSGWYDNDWDYRVKITIPASQVDGDVSNFPVYIDMSDLPSTFHSSVQADADDVRVTADDGETELPIEIVEYNAGSDIGEMYFKTDLSSSVDNIFYVYFGNSGATGYGVSDTYGRNNVWTEFRGVWHMNEDPTGTVIDSTGNGFDMNGVSMESGDLNAGPVGNALTFDGSAEYLETPGTHSEYSGSGGEVMWISAIVSGINTGGSSEMLNSFSQYFGVGQISGCFFIQSSGDNSGTAEAATTVGTEQHQWAFVYTQASSYEIYLDGSSVHNPATSDTESSGTNTLRIANGHGSAANREFQGVIDEVRWAKSDLGASWASVEYNNLSDTDNFYSSNPVAEGQNDLNKDDFTEQVTISENIQIEINGSINVNDDVSAVDYLPEYYEDQLFISEDVQIEIVVGQPDIDISVSDNITIAELVTAGGANINIEVSEDVGITESLDVFLQNFFVSVDDSVTITENLVVDNENLGGVSVNDDITITDEPTVNVVIPDANIILDGSEDDNRGMVWGVKIIE